MSEERFKKCANCENFIPEPAMVCMYCQAEQAGFKKGKGKQIKAPVLYMVIFFLFIVLIIIGNLFSRDTTTTQSGKWATATHQTSVPIPRSSKVGCKATLTTSNNGNIEVTIKGQQINSVNNELQYKAYHPSMGKDIYMDAWRFSNIRC